MPLPVSCFSDLVAPNCPNLLFGTRRREHLDVGPLYAHKRVDTLTSLRLNVTFRVIEGTNQPLVTRHVLVIKFDLDCDSQKTNTC